MLGGGAFSRVSIVTEETTGRQYALKRMRKSAVVQCPEHVFCEQTITRNTAHPFCIRQYGSFQVSSRLTTATPVCRQAGACCCICPILTCENRAMTIMRDYPVPSLVCCRCFV